MYGYSPGPNAIDDQTGFKVKLTALRRQWDGAMVVNPDRRNPQDFVRGVPDRSNLPFARPEAPDQFIEPLVNPVTPDQL